MRGFGWRIVSGIFGFLAMAFLLAACPPSKPDPVRPDADASRPAVTCKTACRHAAAVCATTDEKTCEDVVCGRLGASCAAKLAAAAGCPDVKAACR